MAYWIKQSGQTLSVFFLIIIVTLLAGCGGLAGEPRIVRTAILPTVTPTAPPDQGRPAAQVSLARGAQIFTGPQGCAPCHGASGKGDGPTAPAFACKLPDFSQADVNRSKPPSNWFAITTNGNQGAPSCLMPAWKARLNEQQRWDAVSYAYSLHYTPDQLAQGAKLWSAQCTACHGDRAAGDGPKAKESTKPVPNLADPVYLIEQSDTALWQKITAGINGGHIFKDTMSDDERWAVIAYTRSLTWESNIPLAAQTTPSADSPVVTVRGTLKAGTAGSKPIPAGQTITLRILELTSSTPRETFKLDAQTNEKGEFSFGEVPRQINNVYQATTSYAGITQMASPLRMRQGGGAALDLSFSVYELTEDPAAVQIVSMQIFASPFSANAMLIRQGISFRNSGDRIFRTSRGSVEVGLPIGAQQPTLDTVSTSLFTLEQGANRAIIRANQPLVPGDEGGMGVVVSYLLPFQERPEFAMPTLYPMLEVEVHTPQINNYVVAADAAYLPSDPVQLQDGIYNTFALQGSILRGEELRFSLKNQQEQAVDRRNTLVIVLVITTLMVLLIVLLAWRLNRPPRRRAEGAAA